jgi:hypothetical protein
MAKDHPCKGGVAMKRSSTSDRRSRMGKPLCRLLGIALYPIPRRATPPSSATLSKPKELNLAFCSRIEMTSAGANGAGLTRKISSLPCDPHPISRLHSLASSGMNPRRNFLVRNRMRFKRISCSMIPARIDDPPNIYFRIFFQNRAGLGREKTGCVS